MVSVGVEPGFDFGSSEYEALFAESDATAFQHPVWLAELYRSLGPSKGAEALVVTVREDRRLALVLPLMRRRRNGLRVVEFADLGVSDYAAAICRRGDFDRIAAADLGGRLRQAIRPFDMMRIMRQRADGPDLAALLNGASRRSSDDHAHAVAIEPPFAEWRARSIDASAVRELDRKRRKLGRKGDVRLERAAPDRIPAVFAASRAFRTSRLEGRGLQDVLSDPATLAFYVAVAQAGAASGFATTYELTLDGEIVGTLFGLNHRGRFLVLVTSFDGGFKTLSLGKLLFEDVIADRIAAGDTVFDLTTGDEGYKQQFGTTPTDLDNVVARGSLLGRAADAILSTDQGTRLVKALIGV